ncbi:MAG: hypothetical protein Phog2KO_49940 [Phototrophicaceae bacterium]
MHSKNRFFLLITILLLLMAGQIMAQSDETYTGDIENDRDEDDYTIELDEGDSVIITAIAPDGSDLDTYLTLLNEDGDEVAINDDYEFPDSTNSQIAFTAEDDGEYTIVVSNYPSTDGDYELTIEYVSSDDVADVNGEDTEDDEANQDDLEFDGFVDDDNSDDYEIELEEGQGVVITVVASEDSELDTILVLLNEDGDEVAINDDYEYPDSTNSQIEYVAEEDGEYTIIVSNYPGSEGDYELTVSFENGDSIASIDIDELLDDPDEEYDGFVDDDNEDEYEFELEEGDGVVLTASAAEDSALDTFIYIRNEDGDDLASNDDIELGVITDSRLAYVAEEDGTYIFVVSNYPGSEGDYVATLTYVDAETAELIQGADAEIELDTTPEREPDEEFTGTIGDDEEPVPYVIELDAGQGIIAALYNTDDLMDTLLFVTDPNGVEVGYNDDRGDYTTYDSQVAFTAQEAGEYTFYASNYEGFPGDYRLEIYYADEAEVALAEQAMRVLLSGLELTYDTENFRIHYTEEGADAADFDYVELVGETMEEVLRIQIEELGWVQPPSDLVQGGDARYDVYLINQDGIYGYASSSSALGDNETTEDVIEEFAQAGFLVLDNDYAEFDDAERSLLATAAHEFHHVVQFGYDRGDLSWYYESTASWMETVTFPDDELATIYVEDVFTYPEACFGGDGEADPSGLGVYGTWLFLEFMSETLGEEAPLVLWDNIVASDGWEALELTLEDYDETMPSFLAQYHVNNLVRDYIFVDSFDNTTVWLEDTIDDLGDWENDQDGVQELGANYFALDLDEDVYEFSLDADSDLVFYLIGIDGDEGFVYALGDGETVDTDGYDDVYLMVFNMDYDDDVFECESEEYEITVDEGDSDDAIDASYEVDASNFRELDN